MNVNKSIFVFILLGRREIIAIYMKLIIKDVTLW